MKKSTYLKALLVFLFGSFLFLGKVSAQGAVTITNASNCTPPCDGQASVPSFPGATYIWTPGGQTTATATGLCPGTYSVTATTTFTTVTTSGTVGCSAAVFDFTEASSLKVFPNPASDYVSLGLTLSMNGKFTLSMINMLGEVVSQEVVSVSGKFEKKIDVSHFSKGVYFVRMKNEKSDFVGKFVRE
ncbi:MAG TPA: T9SS type A sorting domain-containing protein [Bacteroidia bacterium]